MYKRLAALVIGLALATTGAMRSSAAKRVGLLVPSAAAATGCTTDSALCLQDGRFLVEATWTKSDGSSGAGHPVNLGVGSGYFWFLDPDNVELVVKALDGCAVNGHGWFFSGGLTNLEVAIAVTDTLTGEVHRYSSPQGVAFQPIADPAAFGCPAGAASMFALNPEEPRDGEPAILPLPAVAERSSAGALGCTEGDTVLCIDGRFQVEASWQTASGSVGLAHAVPLTSGSGYFWFFDPSNVELVVKALDACTIRSGEWFFAAGLTTVGVELRVTDTFTNEVRNYASPLGSRFLPIQDTAAFSFCPTPTPTPSPGITITSTHTRTPTPTPTHVRTTPTSTPTRTLPGAARVRVICRQASTRAFCSYFPSTVQIHAGNTVTWDLNAPYGPHSATASDGSFDSGLRVLEFTHVFPTAGTFDYHCSRGLTFLPHAGVVVVVP